MLISVFCCYAQEDETLLDKLKRHLMALEQNWLVEVWDERSINAGEEREQEISKHLNSAQIILLLVSPDFIASDYCYKIQTKQALERCERGEAKVIPIILRPAYWREGPLSELQALPTDGRPVTSWYNLDEALHDVTGGILRVVKQLSVQQTSNVPVIANEVQPKVVQTGSISLYDVFICHSSKDKPIVEKIIQDLRDNDITYWFDSEQINFGDYITSKIEDDLRRSRNVLVCLSSNLGRSNWCRAEYGPVLHRELNKPSGRKVVPLRLDNCDEDDIPTLLYDIKRADYSNHEEYHALLEFLKPLI